MVSVGEDAKGGRTTSDKESVDFYNPRRHYPLGLLSGMLGLGGKDFGWGVNGGRFEVVTRALQSLL